MNTSDTSKATPFKRLELAIFADTFDGTISKEGRAELVHAFRAFKSEHSALVAVAESAQMVRDGYSYTGLDSALAALAAIRGDKS